MDQRHSLQGTQTIMVLLLADLALVHTSLDLSCSEPGYHSLVMKLECEEWFLDLFVVRFCLLVLIPLVQQSVNN